MVNNYVARSVPGPFEFYTIHHASNGQPATRLDLPRAHLMYPWARVSKDAPWVQSFVSCASADHPKGLTLHAWQVSDLNIPREG